MLLTVFHILPMKSEFVELLKKRVEKVFGRTILSSSDCQLLAIEVFKHTGMKISVNTLRRLYHLMRSQYQPSLFTLDLLAQYCSYHSFSDFISPVQAVKGKNYSSLEINLLNLLADVFRNLKEVRDAGHMISMPEIERRLAAWPDLLDFFKQEINDPDHEKHFEAGECNEEMIFACSNKPVDEDAMD